MDAAAVAEVIATYKKHGWQLRRVLLTGETKRALSDLDLGDVAVLDTTLDMLWFSREPKPGGTAWELRHLAQRPVALVETIDENADSFEEDLKQVEEKLRKMVVGAGN